MRTLARRDRPAPPEPISRQDTTPICPRCEVAFLDGEPHVCAERTEDRSKRVFWIFVCVLLLPFPIAMALARTEFPPLQMLGLVVYLTWRGFVYPHGALRLGGTSTLVFPGWIAPIIAVTQWGSILVVVVLLKRRLRLSRDEQIGAALCAILLVGIAFWVVSLFRGWQMPHMDM